MMVLENDHILWELEYHSARLWFIPMLYETHAGKVFLFLLPLLETIRDRGIVKWENNFHCRGQFNRSIVFKKWRITKILKKIWFSLNPFISVIIDITEKYQEANVVHKCMLHTTIRLFMYHSSSLWSYNKNLYFSKCNP